jgi:hypothetical protein
MALERDTFLPEMSMELPRRRDWRRQRVTFLEASESKDTNVPVSRDAPIEEGQEAEIAAVQRPIITLTKTSLRRRAHAINLHRFVSRTVKWGLNERCTALLE